MLSLGVLLAASLFAAGSANAGTFLTPTLDGDLSEWSSISDTYTNTGATPDIASIKLANDSNYFYMAITFTTPLNLNPFGGGGYSTFLAFDTDSNTATGFNVYGLGTMGSEFSYQNDFPFQQSSGNFSSGSVSNGGGLIAPFGSTSVLTMEIGVPLHSTFDASGLPTFPNPNFNVAMFIDGLDNNNYTGPIAYALAVAVPEPSSLAFLMGGLVLLLGAGRYRRSR